MDSKKGSTHIPQEEIDHELINGDYADKQPIMQFYRNSHDVNEAARFLRRTYGNGAHTHKYLNGSTGFVDYTREGVSFSDSDYSQRRNIPWQVVSKRIAVLIENGQYDKAQ